LGIRLAFLMLAVSVGATACSETTALSPNVNMLVVHAVLDPGVRHQLIVVQTTTGAVEAQRQVTGAVVTIAAPDGRTFTAVERRDTTAVTACCAFPTVTTIYDVDVGSAGLIPGGTYQLRVVALGGRTVTGRTTIPNAVPSTAPAPALTIDRTRDTVSLQWPRVAGARSYQVFIRSTADTYTLFADTSVALPGTLEGIDGHPVAFVKGLTHQLEVIAVDENYFDYYRRASDLFTGAGLIMHLDGGVGVFASAVTVVTRTIVVK
jgi:hypothetical protein